MGKVLLVEDDNNLREIFEMRLQAEGYQTITASDGEEGLAVAMKERPVLIIADVMMPKLSGFEMLETLRAAPEMANVKVVMMTALGQAEDRARGEKLGVVKYLVKSQVTLEDFVRVVREVLPPDQADTAAQPESAGNGQGSDLLKSNKEESENSMQDDNAQPSNQPAPQPDSGAATGNPISGAPAGGDMGGTGQMSTADEQSQVQQQVDSFAPSAPEAPSQPASDSPGPSFGASSGDPAASTGAGGAMPGAGTDSPSAPAGGDSPVAPAPSGDSGSAAPTDASQSSSADNSI